MTPVAPARRRSLSRVPVSIVAIAIILALIVAMALLAPWLAPLDPDRQNLLARLRPPGFMRGGTTYWFGTDNLGRDLLSRVIYGARASLAVASLSVIVSTLVGVSLGMVAGWFRGWAEILIMRLVDIMMSIPAILLAVLTVAVLGPVLEPGPAGTSPTSSGGVIHRGSRSQPATRCARRSGSSPTSTCGPMSTLSWTRRGRRKT